jgi:hypothetical protein
MRQVVDLSASSEPGKTPNHWLKVRSMASSCMRQARIRTWSLALVTMPWYGRRTLADAFLTNLAIDGHQVDRSHRRSS